MVAGSLVSSGDSTAALSLHLPSHIRVPSSPLRNFAIKPDHRADSTLLCSKEYDYNSLGQKIAVVDTDWSRATGSQGLTSQSIRKQTAYDDWGQLYKTTNSSTRTVTISETGPIAMARTEGIQGQGKAKTQLNLSGVPTQITLLLADGSEYSKVDYRYDGLGRLVEEEDALGLKTLYESDSFD
ncbi:hypothetical protein BJY00DRAFT_315800 [Aspergillus carlsbadensis]|nr:hypothetical protein BJY00DRAFT_315800 [Aspergillus carlsbadensis]